jgi:hypothetical protein
VVYTSRALAALRPNYIKIPPNRNEINECKQKFFIVLLEISENRVNCFMDVIILDKMVRD